MRNRRTRKPRKQKRNTRKQKGGFDLAVYEHSNPDPYAMLAPYRGMRWTHGPYIDGSGNPKEGWYISKLEEQRALQRQAEIDAYNDQQYQAQSAQDPNDPSYYM